MVWLHQICCCQIDYEYSVALDISEINFLTLYLIINIMPKEITVMRQLIFPSLHVIIDGNGDSGFGTFQYSTSDLLQHNKILSTHQDNMSVWFISPYIPLLYSKIGVCSKT